MFQKSLVKPQKQQTVATQSALEAYPKIRSCSTMEDSGKSNSNNSKLLNPWVLQFQKMGLELKCPLCLNLFSRPMLLPCNHIFCNSCIFDCPRSGSECAICSTQYAHRDLRQVPFVENMVTIYRSLDITFSANMFQQLSSDDMRVLEPCQALFNSTLNFKSTEKLLETSPGDNLCCERPIFSVATDKHVNDLSLHQCNEFEIGKNKKCERSGIVVHGKSEECSQLEVRGHEECGVVEMETNQVTQSLPDSPPFCDTKGSDNDCSDQDSAHILVAGKLESSSLKRASKANGNLEGRTVQLRSESSGSKSDGLMRELKRQKNLNHAALDVSLKSDNLLQVQHSVSPHCKSVDSCCNLEIKSGMYPDALLPAIPDNSCSNIFICSFCQSSKVSEVTGPMLHYANGDLVMGDAVIQPNVIHVHGTCIDWAPQVYFAGESIKNLKAEVARGAKLKCTKCGLKGAALGCYVKSCRRTYHAPCAMEMSTCRWDCEDFLMLCPAHYHVRFPNEKSKSKKNASQKHHLTSHLASEPSKKALEVSTDDGKNWVFCGSALSAEEKILLINLASRIGATVTKFWTPEVTHVIAATDANGACSRTLKVLMAILKGRWVLKMDWIRACMEATHTVEEEPYEISLDNHRCQGGPKTGRLQAMNNEPKLFSSLNFYFSGDYMPAYKEDLEDLVVAGGGSVLGNKEELLSKGHKCEATSSKLFFVYNLDPPQGCRLGEEVSILWQRLSEAEDLADKTGSQVIGHTWLLESIAACKLQAFVS